MKPWKFTVWTIACGLVLSAQAEDANKGGPNGGRILEASEPDAEFLVTDDRKIEIRFLDESGAVTAPGDRAVSVIMGDRSKPTRLSFAANGDVLVSDGTIPEGNNLPTIVQIGGSGEGAAPVTEKFNLNLSDCPSCDYKEYACVCDHGSGGPHDQGHGTGAGQDHDHGHEHDHAH